MKIYPISLLYIILITSCGETKIEPNITVKDLDGNVYQTVKIGDQIWMSENLNMSKFNNGNENPYWIQSKYGKLYYSKALFSFAGGICPIGWHIPLKSDWEKLFNFLCGDLKTIGGKIKKSDISGWNSSKENNIGFNALPNGETYWDNNELKIKNENSIAVFWGLDTLSVNYFYNYATKANSNEITTNEELGSRYSCRCIKNN